MLKTALIIGLGGGLGSMARHFMNTGISALFKSGFPWGILIVNIVGCFAMGALVALFAGFINVSQETKLFLTAGFLGGFTTFSAFALDTMSLWTSGDVKGAILYVTASVTLSILAVFAGSAIVWKFSA